MGGAGAAIGGAGVVPGGWAMIGGCGGHGFVSAGGAGGGVGAGCTTTGGGGSVVAGRCLPSDNGERAAHAESRTAIAIAMHAYTPWAARNGIGGGWSRRDGTGAVSGARAHIICGGDTA